MTLPKNRILFILILYFGLFAINTYGQDTAQTVTLKAYLKETEKKFKIRFSYAENSIKKIVLSKKTFDNLNATITFLELNTSLKIEQLSERYFTISKDYSKHFICGQTVDYSKIPIGGVKVVTSDGSVIYSDASGYFRFAFGLNKGTTLSFKKTNVESLSNIPISMFDPNCKTIIYLSKEIEQLDEVILSDYLVKGIDKKIDGSLNIKTKELGMISGVIEPDVLENIQALPGINSSSESVSDINIRGGSNDQTLIMWNGVRMYHTSHFFGQVSLFNPYTLSNVTLIKNGTSAQYGDVVSGIIYMSTKNNTPKRFSGGLGFNFTALDTYVNIPVRNKFGLNISLRGSSELNRALPLYKNYFKKIFQNISDPTSQKNIHNFNFSDITLEAIYSINKIFHLKFFYLNITNNLSINITNNGNQEPEAYNDIIQDDIVYGGKLIVNWSDNFKSNLLFSNLTYTFDSSTTENESILQKKNEIIENSLKVDNLLKINDKLQFNGGYHLLETGILNSFDFSNPRYLELTKNVLQTHSLYSEITFKNNNIFLRGGLRVNYFDKFDTIIFEPRFTIAQSLSSHLSLRLQFELKSQSVNQVIDIENSITDLEKKRWVISDNDQTSILKSGQGSIGIDYKKKDINVSIEGYYKIIDGINPTSLSFQNQIELVNIEGEQKSIGLEFFIQKK